MPKKDRNRQNIDVDSRLQEFIRNLADELSVTESQLWNFFVAEGMRLRMVRTCLELPPPRVTRLDA